MIINRVFAQVNLNANLFEGAELPDLIVRLYELLVIISGLLIMGSFIYAGFLFITSAGNVGKVREAKQRISDGIIGVIIILSSWMVVYIINPELTTSLPFDIDRKYPTVEESKTESLEESYFQIPLGQLIDQSVLDDDGQKKMNDLMTAVNNAAKAAEEFADESQALNKLVQTTYCGGSICAGCCSPSCSEDGRCCTGEDHRKEILSKVDNDIEGKTIPELNQKAQTELTIAKMPVIEDILNLETAGQIMSEAGSVLMHINDVSRILNSPPENTAIEITSYPRWPSGRFTDWFYSYSLNQKMSRGEDPVTFYISLHSGSQGIVNDAGGFDWVDGEILDGVCYIDREIYGKTEKIPYLGIFGNTDRCGKYGEKEGERSCSGGTFPIQRCKEYGNLIWMPKEDCPKQGTGKDGDSTKGECWLDRAAYDAYKKLINRIKSELGSTIDPGFENLRIDYGYRDYWGQVWRWCQMGRGRAAYPGNSPHKSGLAFDFEMSSNFGYAHWRQFNWYKLWELYAHDYGFYNCLEAPTCGLPEPWHWEFRNKLKKGESCDVEEKEWVIFDDMKEETETEKSGDRRIRPLYDAEEKNKSYLKPVPTKYLAVSQPERVKKANKIATTQAGCLEATMGWDLETHRYDERIDKYFRGFIDELTRNVNKFNDILKKSGDLGKQHSGEYDHLNISRGMTWSCSNSDFKLLLFYRDPLWQTAMWCDDKEFSALPGQSAHMTGRTFDFNIPSSTRCIGHPEVFKEVRRIGEKWGFYATEYDTPDPDLCARLRLGGVAEEKIKGCENRRLWEWWHWEYNPPIKK